MLDPISWSFNSRAGTKLQRSVCLSRRRASPNAAQLDVFPAKDCAASSLLFRRGVQLDEGVSCRDLKARLTGMEPALLLHPSVDELRAKIQAAHRIPDNVGGRIGALVVGVGRLKRRVLHLHKTNRRVRSYCRRPVVLVTAIRCKDWQRSQR